ncbi:unnamed protein product [Phytophthora lilii]|uniref:Unnamed protein product n=1 Tax=Phytophthora lilii TaxID=2077276 RepID=A0A9W6TW19_9STRA|nr:unnamed protein product [Phytophthora lilii]
MFPNFTSLAQREQKRRNFLKELSAALDKLKPSEGYSSESAESLKKTLSDGYSQTNPEVSTPNVRPVMIDAEVDAEARMTDGWVHMRPDTSDRNIQPRSQTSDFGVNVSPQTSDIEIDGTPQTAEAETNTKIRLVDTEDQLEARSWVKNLYNANPN